MKKIKVSRKIIDRVLDRDNKIRSCKGTYSLRDTADYFGMSYESVRRIWDSRPETDLEPPNIRNTSRHPALYEDGVILMSRNLTLRESAKQLGVSYSHLRNVLASRPTGRELIERDKETRELWKAGRMHPRGSYGPPNRADYPNKS